MKFFLKSSNHIYTEFSWLNSVQMQPLFTSSEFSKCRPLPIPTCRQLYTSWRDAYENMFPSAWQQNVLFSLGQTSAGALVAGVTSLIITRSLPGCVVISAFSAFSPTFLGRRCWQLDIKSNPTSRELWAALRAEHWVIWARSQMCCWDSRAFKSCFKPVWSPVCSEH